MKAKFPMAQFDHLQMKYCERCGQLWLRPTTSTHRLCPACTQAERALDETPGSFLRLWRRLRAEAQA